jgi:adenylate cyclase
MSGVEIPVTLLFSDIRGSTAMGERLRPTEFHEFLDPFYRLASDAVLAHDGLVDKVVGDEIVALFFGGISGPDHPGAAVAAAIDLAERAARPDATPSGPIPVGTAVHTGEAFVGATGPPGTIEDFTALGDVVNTTARLASAARAGEVIVSVAAAEAAGADGVERRIAEIRGREEPIEVMVLRPADVETGVSS